MGNRVKSRDSRDSRPFIKSRIPDFFFYPKKIFYSVNSDFHIFYGSYFVNRNPVSRIPNCENPGKYLTLVGKIWRLCLILKSPLAVLSNILTTRVPARELMTHYPTPAARISFRHYLIPNEKKKMNSFHFPSSSFLDIAKLKREKEKRKTWLKNINTFFEEP